ncbi:exonuclease domain-containing protein [Flavihumibacter stibioxidans]|uniref:GIY-YIG domain-containing protein n=1 Tax=Flavihumibacter stibioxidans TaxID=1834163 RepID=A0ABR7MDQ8_9BACT|nr:exonuclease domain-containing protein [Flavihumibacter stibioxidans]MBC6493167.1 hypothetical protein [Flavihumibacter stibioxidans]
MYAIVDIETTGGFASGNGITEVAVVLHNGREEEGRYSTLINPRQPIPRHITALTGITNEMVADKPGFDEVAPHLFNLLSGRIFVAHNVNFDYSFIKSHLDSCGYDLQVKKLCTVRLARKIYPGHHSYSLGNLCRTLDIGINNRHRAEGDADATARLFSKMIRDDAEGHILKMTRGKNAEQFLPPNLPAEDLEALPYGPGVYYFENQKKEIIYVGKALNLRNRVRSHFSNNDGNRRKQELMRQVYHVRFRECSSELMALILESQEIRKHWPLFNRSQKKYHHRYGLYSYEDSKGYLQLVIEKKRNHLPALYTFNLLQEGHAFIRKLTGSTDLPGEAGYQRQELREPPAVYNARLNKAIDTLQAELPSFVLVEKDYYAEDRYAVYLLEKGCFYGMGNIHDPYNMPLLLGAWKEKIEPSPDNDYIRGLVYQFAEKKAFTRLSLNE